MGFGAVIKAVFHFDHPFWESKVGKNTGFFFIGGAFPTWWPDKDSGKAILTAWLAGPDALKYSGAKEEHLLQLALSSLGHTFGMANAPLSERLLGFRIYNWADNVYSKGAYTYPTVRSQGAAGTLSEPVEDTLYFAGEAVYEGAHGGTVEAALVSGTKAAELISKAD